MASNSSPGAQHEFVVVVVEHVVLGAAATVAVFLRFFARQKTKVKVGWDDWLSLVSWILMWGYTAITSLAFHPDIRHALEYTPPNFKKANDLKLLNWLSIVVVASCQVAARLSLIFLYHRLFSVSRRMTKWLKILGILSLIWLLQMYIGLLLLCRPIKAIFDGSVQGQCINARYAYIATTSCDMVLDLAVLSLPIPVIWKLFLPVEEKVGIAAMFLSGAMVVATGLVRIGMATKATTRDVQSLMNTSLWDGIHVGFCIISSCLPVFRVFLPRHKKSMLPVRSVGRLYNSWKTSWRSRGADNSNSQGISLPSFVRKPEPPPRTSDESTSSLNHRQERDVSTSKHHSTEIELQDITPETTPTRQP